VERLGVVRPTELQDLCLAQGTAGGREAPPDREILEPQVALHQPASRLTSTTPPSATTMPSISTGPSRSPNNGHASIAVVGGTRKNRLATREASPRRRST